MVSYSRVKTVVYIVLLLFKVVVSFNIIASLQCCRDTMLTLLTTSLSCVSDTSKSLVLLLSLTSEILAVGGVEVEIAEVLGRKLLRHFHIVAIAVA